MTPTNWPNPERPGVPMFPERDGWHWVTLLGEPIAVKWDAPSESWRLGNYSYYPGPDWDLNWEYRSPIFTPTQINEMLAAERERCLTIAIDEQWNFPSNPTNQTAEAAVAFKACERIIKGIRNLGAAP